MQHRFLAVEINRASVQDEPVNAEIAFDSLSDSKPERVGRDNVL
jgi:hypothetical protein